MRTGEHNDVGMLPFPLDERRLDLGPDRSVVHRVAAHVGLSERSEIGRTDKADVAVAGIFLDERARVFALDGADGSEDADVTATGLGGGGLHRADGTDERHRMNSAERRPRQW